MSRQTAFPESEAFRTRLEHKAPEAVCERLHTGEGAIITVQTERRICACNQKPFVVLCRAILHKTITRKHTVCFWFCFCFFKQNYLIFVMDNQEKTVIIYSAPTHEESAILGCLLLQLLKRKIKTGKHTRVAIYLSVFLHSLCAYMCVYKGRLTASVRAVHLLHSAAPLGEPHPDRDSGGRLQSAGSIRPEGRPRNGPLGWSSFQPPTYKHRNTNSLRSQFSPTAT